MTKHQRTPLQHHKTVCINNRVPRVNAENGEDMEMQSALRSAAYAICVGQANYVLDLIRTSFSTLDISKDGFIDKKDDSNSDGVISDEDNVIKKEKMPKTKKG